MSRLNDLLKKVQSVDPSLGSDLLEEVRELTKRRTFGLVFEPHQPEAVELPQRRIRKGDKVRVLPARGSLESGERRLWWVVSFESRAEGRAARLVEVSAVEPEQTSALIDDLVVVAEFNDRIYPGLVETGRIERGGDKPFHTVINAENFHALELLTYTHRHSVDAIYIDPPYNTGARDWKYNNDYVERDDGYRHSKWLAFMDRRLKIARDLLNPENSALIVTIDEKEVHRLALLLDQVFPEANIQMVSTVIAQKGVARAGQFYRTDEYLFLVLLGDAKVEAQALSDEWKLGKGVSGAAQGVVWSQLRRSGTNSLRTDRPGLFFPIFVDPKGPSIKAVGASLPAGTPVESISPPEAGLEVVWPVRADGTEANWQQSPDALMRLVQKGYVRLGQKNDNGFPISYLKRGSIQKIESGRVELTGRHPAGGHVIVDAADYQHEFVPGSQWNIASHDATYHGTQLLTRLLGSAKFPFPKSLYAVEDTLRFFIKGKPDAVILDFFAGSGTTAHAVMRLNRQDNGHRQCISVTNNEVSAEEQKALRKAGLRPGDANWEALGICDYITKPRIEAAITGRTPQGQPIAGDYKFTDEFSMQEGFEENAAFFTLTYEGPLSVSHHRSFDKVAPLLWMRAGSRGPRIDSLGERGWDVADTYGVLENLDNARDFIETLNSAPHARFAFVVTDDGRAFQMVCSSLPAHITPVRLYESYLTNFEINSGRKG